MDKMGRFAQYYCEDCDVQLHDDENFKNHLRGKPHLKQMQRIVEDRARRGLPNYDSSHVRTGMSYYELPSQYSATIGQFYRRRSDSDHEDKYNRRSKSPRRSRSPRKYR